MPSITWTETQFLKVPLTDTDVQARGEQLAKELHNLRDLRAEHKTAKDAMKNAEESGEGRVAQLARIVRDRVEERSVPVEIRVDLGLRMVEEIRSDTGEIMHTRPVTEEDTLRARIEAQATIPGIEAPER